MIHINSLFTIILVFTLTFSGCASKNKPIPSSDPFTTSIKRDIIMTPIIDTTKEKRKSKDLKDIDGYDDYYKTHLLPWIDDKGYAYTVITPDVSSCPSIKDINAGDNIACLGDTDKYNSNIFVMISIDDYIPPKSLGITSTIHMTGMIYDIKNKKLLWKNTGTYEAGNETVRMYGPAGYLEALTAKATMSEDKRYRYAAYEGLRKMVRAIPDCPDEVCPNRTRPPSINSNTPD